MKLSELTERRCAFCDDPYMPHSPRQRFCSVDCRYRNATQLRYEARMAAKAVAEAQ